MENVVPRFGITKCECDVWGAMVFIGDFTAWVAGLPARSTRNGIEAIINDALDWERRSGEVRS
jgi:hypothetical protein